MRNRFDDLWVATGLTLAVTVAGCGGDDTQSTPGTGASDAAVDVTFDTSATYDVGTQLGDARASGDEVNAPDVATPDAAAQDGSLDAPTVSDSAAEAQRDAAGSSDAPHDAALDAVDAPSGPAHVVFVTSASYTGDLVSSANALIGDENGVAAPDGGSFAPGSGVAAANALCQMHARRAGFSGTFKALIQDRLGDVFGTLHDSDGPWVLTTGTAVAATLADLKAGRLRVSVDVTETRVRQTNGWGAWGWMQAGGGDECLGWSYGSATLDSGADSRGVVGGFENVGEYWLNYSQDTCDMLHPLYCLEVGPGGGPLVMPALPNGAKIVFAAPGPLRGDFATSAVTDGGVDAVHVAADLVCSQAAAASGRAGTFRAWMSSSSKGALDYFSGLGMNGPWYRPDGFLVAPDRATLVGPNGIADQIALDAAGLFVNMRLEVWSGSGPAGNLAENCNDFTSANGSSYGDGAGITYKTATGWGSGYEATCDTSNLGIYCFEQ